MFTWLTPQEWLILEICAKVPKTLHSTVDWYLGLKSDKFTNVKFLISAFNMQIIRGGCCTQELLVIEPLC